MKLEISKENVKISLFEDEYESTTMDGDFILVHNRGSTRRIQFREAKMANDPNVQYCTSDTSSASPPLSNLKVCDQNDFNVATIANDALNTTTSSVLEEDIETLKNRVGDLEMLNSSLSSDLNMKIEKGRNLLSDELERLGKKLDSVNLSPAADFKNLIRRLGIVEEKLKPYPAFTELQKTFQVLSCQINSTRATGFAADSLTRQVSAQFQCVEATMSLLEQKNEMKSKFAQMLKMNKKKIMEYEDQREQFIEASNKMNELVPWDVQVKALALVGINLTEGSV